MKLKVVLLIVLVALSLASGETEESRDAVKDSRIRRAIAMNRMPVNEKAPAQDGP